MKEEESSLVPYISVISDCISLKQSCYALDIVDKCKDNRVGTAHSIEDPDTVSL